MVDPGGFVDLTGPNLGEADAGTLLTLLAESRVRGFLGPGPLDVHLRHALGFAALVPATGAVLDLGAGGGVPGLVLLAALPALTMTLLESSQRRCRFLVACIEQAGWSDRATVVEARAEDAARSSRWRHQYDAVVARSFGAPAVTAECAAPFLRVGGVLVVSEPPEGPDTVDRWPPAGLAELGLRRQAANLGAGSPHFAVMSAEVLCSDRFPRRVGLPAKRLLFQ